jgi:hypothetical protein
MTTMTTTCIHVFKCVCCVVLCWNCADAKMSNDLHDDVMAMPGHVVSCQLSGGSHIDY